MSSAPPTLRVSNANLGSLPDGVRVPAYDRSQLRQHTVHLGVGGFHRAHQAVYLDDLLGMEGSELWGECGVGVLRSDLRMRDALRSQDFLYTVVERSAQAQSARVIGSIADYLYVPEQREAAIERVAALDTRIVSLTITEGGYYIDEASGDFLDQHPDIQHDLQHPKEPASSIGLIAEGLDRRRQRGLAPFTVMSCDNLQGNGDVIRRVLLAYSGLANRPLQQWIGDYVAFPNSMVDRITPATTPADISSLTEHFKIADTWPVVTEPFRQWVVEDTFANGRPAWERVGAEFTSDVAPYEIMKIRLLNGSHLAMAYLGALHGYERVHEIMLDPLFRMFIQRFMEQVTPVVPLIAGTSIEDYKRTLMERFSNPTINDQVTRICSEGSAKIPKWLLPSILELLRLGAPIELLALVVASWIFYFGQTRDERGKPLEIVDARSVELARLGVASRGDAGIFLKSAFIFGTQLPANPRFVQSVEEAFRRLSDYGVLAALKFYVSITL